MKVHHLCAASLMALASLGASAQNQKPGLWEITTKMRSNGEADDKMAKARERMASLPPEQRKMVEDMMAKQGVSMTGAPGGGMAVKMCLTQEMIDRNHGGAGMQRPGCTSTMSPRVGNTMKLNFTCTQPPSTGEGTYTFNGTEAYTMQMNTTVTVQGKPAQSTIEASGKWLSADCGGVQPISAPK